MPVSLTILLYCSTYAYRVQFLLPMLPTSSLLPTSPPQDPKPLHSTLGLVSPEQLHQEWEEKQEREWLQQLHRGGEEKKQEWGEKREWEEKQLQECLQRIHRWWEERQDIEEKPEWDKKQEWEWLPQIHRLWEENQEWEQLQQL